MREKLPKNQPLVTIFGLCSEGYRIASTLSKLDIQTVLIDENMQVGMKLKKEMFPNFESIKSLLESETLISLEPMDSAISKANFLIFAPKIRGSLTDGKAIVTTKLRNVSKYLSNGVTFVNMLPTGQGGNQENISLLEKLTGLKADNDFNYVYAPTFPGSNEPIAIGTNKTKIDAEVIKILNSFLIKTCPITLLEQAELLHLRYLMNQYSSIAVEFEICKKLGGLTKLTDTREIVWSDIYLENIVSSLFDIKVVSEAYKTGEPINYIISGALKSIESYFRYLIDKIRIFLREEGLKASRIKILVAWMLDLYEIRGEKISTLSTIFEKLRDCVSDVSTFDKPVVNDLYSREKTNIVVACSKKDFERVKKLGFPIIVKANLPVEISKTNSM